MLKHGKKRVLAILLAIAMVAALLPLGAMAIDDDYGLYVAGDWWPQSVNHNGTGWTWNTATKTLALDGDYEGSWIEFNMPYPVTISVTGEVDIHANNFAIRSESPLTITGTGILNAGGNEVEEEAEEEEEEEVEDRPYAGIAVYADITITGSVTVNSTGKNNPAIVSVGYYGYMPITGTITIGAASTLNLIDAGDNFPGVYGKLVNNGTLKYNDTSLNDYATSLASEIAGYDGGEGSLTANVSADGKTVTITGTVTDAENALVLQIPAGIKVVWEASITSEDFGQPLVVVLAGVFEVATGGSISAKGEDSAGILIPPGYDAEVNITGGTVSAEGGGSSAIQAYSGDINVSGGTITATGEASTAVVASTPPGYPGFSRANISGGTITATGDSAVGVVAAGNAEFNITGGNITAAGEDAVAVGAFSGGGGSITGGTITATGEDSYALYYDVQQGSTVTVGGGAHINGAVEDGTDPSDVTKPTIEDSVIWWDDYDEDTDGATGVGLDGRIVFYFSETMVNRPDGPVGTVTLNPGNITLDAAFGGWNGPDEYGIYYENLEPNTTYTITVAGFKDINGNVMLPDSSLSFTTLTLQLSGDVYIVGTHAYGQTLTADISELDTYPEGYPLGTISYEWYNFTDDRVVGTGSSYKIQASDIGDDIDLYVTVANATGEIGDEAYTKVEKAPADDLGAAYTTIYIPVGTSGQQTFDLSGIALKPAYGETGGVISYSVDSVDGWNNVESNVLSTSPAPYIADDTLNYRLNDTSTEDEGAWIDIEIETANFENVIANIYLRVTSKTVVPITGVNIASRAYNGQPIAYTGTPTAAGKTKELIVEYYGQTADGYEYEDYDTPPTKAGTYELFISTDDDDSVIGYLSIPFTISKAPLTIKADNKSVTVGGEEPAYTYTVQGLVGGDTEEYVIATPPTAFSSGNLNKAGSYPIEVSGGYLALDDAPYDKGYNYEIVGYTPGTLTVSAPGGGGGGGGIGGGGSAAQTATAADGAVSVSFTQSGGTVTPELPAAKVDEIIEKTTGFTASIDLSGIAGSNAAVLPTQALDAFADAGLDLELKLASGTVKFSEATLNSIVSQATGDNVTVTVNTVPHSALTAAQRAAIKSGDIVLDITITSGAQVIHNFDGTITVTVPYSGPLPVAVWYLNDAGELEKLESTYDPATKTVTFTLNHLSLYVLAQDTAWKNPFTDVKVGDWFYGDVEYAAVNGLFNGTSPTTFSPNAAMTRAMLVTVLARLDGVDTDGGATWYTKALEWGVENGITDGTNPESNITREQLATMIVRYADYAGKTFPLKLTYAEFADDDSISGYAKTAVQTLFIGGIINGKPGNLFDPKGDATRAEVAAILHRFADAVK
jgi:hypothetical protein